MTDEPHPAVEVTVDRTVCIGAQVCRAIAPTVFDIDDEGLAFVVAGATVPLALVEQAARECPTSAIHVR